MTITGAISLESYEELLQIARAADELESWLGANVGTNADWPMQITGDAPAKEKFCQLMNQLAQSLKPGRERKPQ